MNDRWCAVCASARTCSTWASSSRRACSAIRFLQLHWEQLADDIEAGSLTPYVADPSVPDAVVGILRPDPELARFVRAECSRGHWAGIVTRAIPILEYYSGRLPMACTMYASSDCYFGLNLRPLCHPSEVCYTIMPNMGYFEFLPWTRRAAWRRATRRSWWT